jgi:hypothetical protein
MSLTEDLSINLQIQQFLSDVGGAIGLWIGLSILSLCEVIQLIMELCHYAGHKILKNGRGNRKNRDTHHQGRSSDKGIYDLQNDKESRWVDTGSSNRGRINQTESFSNDRGYHSDSDRRFRNERYNDIRLAPDDPRDHYDDIRERYSDFRNSRRFERPSQSYY